MTDKDEYKDLLKHKHFLGEVEQGIRFANNEIIHQKIPTLNKDNILSFAIAVGRLRANYLETALKLGQDQTGELPEPEIIDNLKRHRQLYEEARLAFEALREAIEKGYVDVDILLAQD
ncbi:MAG TPA: hypothetical protein ENI69_01880 [Rhodospirillales bacterium]|nr:hypothetical protein [Rhodospirillales bacterium]